MDAMYAIDDTTVTAGNDIKDLILIDPRYKALLVQSVLTRRGEFTGR